MKEKGNNIFYCRVTWNLINVFYVWWSSKGRCQTSQNTWHLYFLSPSPSQPSVLIIIKSHNNLCLFCLLLLVDSWQELQKNDSTFPDSTAHTAGQREPDKEMNSSAPMSLFSIFYSLREVCCSLLPATWLAGLVQKLFHSLSVHFQNWMLLHCRRVSAIKWLWKMR